MITKQALGNTLWGMADILRDKVEDYKAYILSLLFFKRLSDNYEWEIENGIREFRADYGAEPNEKQKALIAKQKHDFIIPEGCFWEDVRLATTDKKNARLDEAVNAIADENPALKGVINTVRWNEPAPDGSGSKKLSPDVLTSLISYLNAVDLSNRNASADVLGDAYEYLIKRFADENRGGTTAGQFYTPPEVVDLIVRYLKPQKGHTAYDPTCGSGGFLISAAKYARQAYGSAKEIRLFGQEDVWNTWAIANINMILHGLDAQVKKGDTLKDPKFHQDDDPLAIRQFDLVMANFPFSQEDWWKNGDVKKDRKGVPVKKKDGSPQKEYPGRATFNDPFDRFTYGLPPFSNGDFAFLQHIIASMTDTGRGGVVCPQGVLFRGQPEKTEDEDGQNRKADDEYLIRRGLLQGPADENGEFMQGINIIDAIVVLPANLFYGTTIPGAIVLFNKHKPEARRDKVLMVYAAREGWYREDANMNTLLPHDMLRISTLLESWGDETVAANWITDQKSRLRGLILEELTFKEGEIETEYADDISTAETRLLTAQTVLENKEKARKNPTAADLKAVQTAQNALDKLTTARDAKLRAAREQAIRERRALDEVETELLTMLADADLRKRYFSVVSMAELEENEFNLNIPRYVDTFEPEEEIDLQTAIAEFDLALSEESRESHELSQILALV